MFQVQRALILSVVVSLVGLALVACGGEEEMEPAPPVAEAFFLHANPQQGPLEVRLGDQIVVKSLAPGMISPATTLALGSSMVSVRAPGAQADLLSAPVELAEQPYLFTVDSDGIDVDTAAPPMDLGEGGALRVIDISGLSLDVYAGAAKLGDGFTNVVAGDVTLAVYNEGVDPSASVPAATLTRKLPAGEVGLVLIRNNGMTPPGVLIDALGF
jgi:hypothetical protein